MSESYELLFHVKPVAKARPRMMRNGHTYTPETTRLAEDELRWLMKAQFKHSPLDRPLKVEILVTIERPKSCPKSRIVPSVRPDCDNYAKLVLDSGNEILWVDDSLIVDLRVRKEYGEPSIKLLVGEI